ncbi:MAG: hypothetical protein ACKOUT_01345, partial [Novosphingobium sp.]
MRSVPVPMRQGAPPFAPSRRAFGVASLDGALEGGLACGRIHEIYAAEAGDAAAVAGFSVAVAAGMAEPGQTVLWLRMQRA